MYIVYGALFIQLEGGKHTPSKMVQSVEPTWMWVLHLHMHISFMNSSTGLQNKTLIKWSMLMRQSLLVHMIVPSHPGGHGGKCQVSLYWVLNFVLVITQLLFVFKILTTFNQFIVFEIRWVSQIDISVVKCINSRNEVKIF